MMNLNDLLQSKNIAPQNVIVFRHRPNEPELNKVLPWLAAEKPELFNTYQQSQSVIVEGSMQKLVGQGYVASFIGHKPGKALFVGLYSIAASKPMTYQEYWQYPGHIELKKFGMNGFIKKPDRSSVLFFDLKLITDFYEAWKGKLIVSWPPPEKSWWRRAHKNEMPVIAIHEESALDSVMPKWDELELTWEQLGVLPTRWKYALSEWRVIYYIFDISDGKGYVGSAYGDANLLRRWENYAVDGDGGNKFLKQRDAQNFRFTILQRVSPDMDKNEIIKLENSWKQRLHTRKPYGLNDN